MGRCDGSIIAAIITTHIVRNEAVASIQVCPGIRIQVIDIVQPPGIGIPRISDMDAHQSTVSAVLAANSEAEIPTKARSDAISASTLRQIPGCELLAKDVVGVM